MMHLIIFTRQWSEDLDVLDQNDPDNITLFHQLVNELELSTADTTLLHINRGSGDEYQILATIEADRDWRKLRDRLQEHYNDGAAGTFNIIGFSDRIVPLTVR